MSETLQQLLRRYVKDDTYSFHGFKRLEVNSIGREKQTLLHLACRREALEDVKLLLENGANVNAQDDLHSTPLHSAVLRRSYEIVELLLAAGADPHLKSDFGKSAFETAEEIDKDGKIADLIRARWK